MEDDQYQLDQEGYYQLEFIVPLPRVVDYRGGVIRYQPNWIPTARALELFKGLRKYEGDAENAKGYTPAGKPYIAERRSIQISDPGVRVYKFSGSTAVENEPFTNYSLIDGLRREVVYMATGVWTNYCLYTAYTPEAKLGWHSDSEKDMVEGSTIISLSFGDTRRFRVRLQDNHNVVHEFYLESGSILTMEGECQKLYDHAVWDITQRELASVVHGLRINLTFRVMKPQ